jgi:uncharacterized protein with GYD domain
MLLSQAVKAYYDNLVGIRQVDPAGGNVMATYIVLANFTDQGIRNIKDTTKRADAFKKLAKSMGANVKELYWTLGTHDIICVIEGQDDTEITAIGLALGKSGNVRTQTLRAFSQADMEAILGKVT